MSSSAKDFYDTQAVKKEDSLKLSKQYKEIPLKCGVKYDGEKPMLSLIPASLLIETGKVLTYGANKYAAHNWREGINQSRLISAALRHIIAFNEGEDNDSESGLHHLAHAICELSFALEQSLNPVRYDAYDDRYTS